MLLKPQHYLGNIKKMKALPNYIGIKPCHEVSFKRTFYDAGLGEFRVESRALKSFLDYVNY